MHVTGEGLFAQARVAQNGYEYPVWTRFTTRYTKQLVNLPKRVDVDRLTARQRSTGFLQQQHEGISQLGVVCVNVVWLKLEMKHELQR